MHWFYKHENQAANPNAKVNELNNKVIALQKNIKKKDKLIVKLRSQLSRAVDRLKQCDPKFKPSSYLMEEEKEEEKVPATKVR